VVLAAGMARRYGRLKQLEPVGPTGEALLDYGIRDAANAGFGRAVAVIRREIEAEFRRHFEAFRPSIDIAFAYQDTGVAARAGGVTSRTKPWGTGHAVLAAAPHLETPFAVMNADDYYGRESFELLVASLSALDVLESQGVLIGFELGSTLSPEGGVSRALIETDADGWLTSIVERADLRVTRGGVGGTPDGRVIDAAMLVSMNLWGFTPAVLPLLGERFELFLDRHSRDPDAEFLLPAAIGDAVQAGSLRVRVVRTTARWMGLTHPGDRPAVEKRLRRLGEASSRTDDSGQVSGHRPGESPCS
jgi:hypothetical protein